jgi:hypothetical protein
MSCSFHQLPLSFIKVKVRVGYCGSSVSNNIYVKQHDDLSARVLDVNNAWGCNTTPPYTYGALLQHKVYPCKICGRILKSVAFVSVCVVFLGCWAGTIISFSFRTCTDFIPERKSTRSVCIVL